MTDMMKSGTRTPPTVVAGSEKVKAWLKQHFIHSFTVKVSVAWTVDRGRANSFAVRPLTPPEVAAGGSHAALDIDRAQDTFLPIPLRRDRDHAYVAHCYCAFCESRRTRYLRF